jgi:uncharacterized protein (TIGR02452 family)
MSINICSNRNPDGTKNEEAIKIRRAVARDNYYIQKNSAHKFNLNITAPISIPVRDSRFEHIFKRELSQIFFYQGTSNQAIHWIDNHSKKTGRPIKMAVMNFANSHHVGGGYLKGSMAQEEELCRTIVDLFPSLTQHATRKKTRDGYTTYEYNNFIWSEEVKYNSDLTLIKLDCAQSKKSTVLYDQFGWTIKVSVITAAAPNLGNDKQIELFKKNPMSVIRGIKNVIRQCILAPVIESIKSHQRGIRQENTNVLILGAFGCGAFAPSKELEQEMSEILGKAFKYNAVIASLFAEVLTEENANLLKIYDSICFAIPYSKSDDNYITFRNVIGDALTNNRIRFIETGQIHDPLF